MRTYKSVGLECDLMNLASGLHVIGKQLQGLVYH